MRNPISIVSLFFIFVFLAGCTCHKQYRTKYEVCPNSGSDFTPSCNLSAIQTFMKPDPPGFSLSIIEFDDQGKLWNREQKAAVLNQLKQISQSNDLLLVVFVHGWLNNADPKNERLDTFKSILTMIAENEAAINAVKNEGAGPNAKQHPRKVAGVYLGWRGESIWIPGLRHVATFWDRKNTANKIGHGAVTEVLSEFEKLIADKQTEAGSLKENNLVVIGHSFGGLIVNNAVSQILQSRFVRTTDTTASKGLVGGFGNLVILLNPAFEALEIASLSDMSTERKDYDQNQLPILTILTSEADYATKYAFPVGRFFSTFFETTDNRSRNNPISGVEENISTYGSNLKAVGHFEPYQTHWLYPSKIEDQSVEFSTNERVIRALDASEAWRQDEPGRKISFQKLTLERSTRSAGRNPYLIIKVDKDLIPDHSDIRDPRILSFLSEMVLISTTPEQKKNILQKKIMK